MITLEPDYTRGTVRIFGATPNGAMTVTRKVGGMADVLVRGGAYTITVGGVVLLDTEAPYSVPLYYQVSVGGISLPDRLIQQNLMPNPTFTRGLQGWLPGTGRTLVISSDPAAKSPVVGHVSSGTSSAPAAAPTFIGHADSGAAVNSPYTLTIPTTGGTAAAVGDQMIVVHQQLSSVATPAAPAGWTQLTSRTGGGIARVIWSRTRIAGDNSVTVAAAAGSNSIGSVLWVRGAIAEVLFSDRPALPTAAGGTVLSTPRKTVLRGHLTVAVVDAYTVDSSALPTAPSTTGGTWRYSLGPATGTRSVTVATFGDAQAGDTIPTVTTFAGPLITGGAVDVIFQAAGSFAGRVIARAKTTALAAASDPYLLTGRVRYVTLGLWTWADVKAQGTWQNLKNTKSTWLDVRGGDSSVNNGFATLFLRIVNPVDDTDYVPPSQVLVGADTDVNTWLDFSAAIPVGTDIPATAEIQLLHGNQVKEYAADWYLDQFGITPGLQVSQHDTLYWFSGDSPLPASTEDLLFPDGAWTSTGAGASISWAGTAGNSISNLYGPTSMSATSVTQLNLPEDIRIPSEPVLLSDPLDMDLWCWVGLLRAGDLVHPSRQAINQIINRADPTANSQVRLWETGDLTVLTHTLQERERFLKLISSGRVLILRNPETEYPETNWYLAIGDVTESRVIPNQRKQERSWVLPYVRVRQPVGVAARNAAKNTWQDVRDNGTWAQALARWESWLDMLVDDA